MRRTRAARTLGLTSQGRMTDNEGNHRKGRPNLHRLGILIPICVSRAACVGVSDDSNTFVSPSGRIAHAPPARLRNGNGGGSG
jgi:hypothetical protein